MRPGSLEFIFDQLSMRYPWMSQLLWLSTPVSHNTSFGFNSPPGLRCENSFRKLSTNRATV